MKDSGKPQQEGGRSRAGAGHLVPCRPVKGWTHVLLTEGRGRSEPDPRQRVPFKARGQLWSSCPGQSKGHALSRWYQAENDNPALPFPQDRGLFLPQPSGSSPESRGIKNLLSSSCCSSGDTPPWQSRPRCRRFLLHGQRQLLQQSSSAAAAEQFSQSLPALPEGLAKRAAGS